MSAEDLNHVPSISEAEDKPLADAVGESNVHAEAGSVESATAAAARCAQAAFDAEWMSFVTRCPQNKTRDIAEGHLDRITAELGEDVVGRIVRGVEQAGRRRVGGLAWGYFLKRDTDGYERIALKHDQPRPDAAAAIVAEIRRWVGNQFPELPSDALSVLLFRAADKAALESLPLPNCEHAWQRTSLPAPGKRHGVAFEGCSKCSALRPVLYTEEGDEEEKHGAAE